MAILAVLALNIGCDQVSKSIVRKEMNYNEPISLLQNHFTLIKIENTGAFLSLGDDLVNPYRFILLTLLPVLALTAAVVFIIFKNSFSKIALTGIICVIGGGVGNIYDRIAHGSVTDFMHLRFGIFQTGIFNAADVSIMIGVGLILLDAWVKKRRGKSTDRSVTAQVSTSPR